MPASTLKKINRRAKEIRKKHPNKTWKAAQKQAGKEVSSGKVSGVAKKRRTRVAGTKGRVAAKRKRVGDVEPKYEVVHQLKQVNGISYKGGSIRLAGMGDVNRQKAQLKASLGQQAGWLDVAISSAKTKREKTALRKKKAEVLRELNRIK